MTTMEQHPTESISFGRKNQSGCPNHSYGQNGSLFRKILLLAIVSALAFFDDNASTAGALLPFPSCHASTTTFSSYKSYFPNSQNHHLKTPLSTTKSTASPLSKRKQKSSLLYQLRGGASAADQGRSSWAAGSTARPSQQGVGSSTTTNTGWKIDNHDDEKRKTQEEKEMTKEMVDAFLKRDDRQKFIARVYSILSCQLITTSIFVFFFGKNPGLRYWMLTKGRIVPFLSLAISTICTITLSSSLSLRRSKAKSFQLLTLFTICESIVVGFISSFYKFQSVVSAMLLTACSTLSITMYTLMQKNPKWDLSLWGSGLSSCAMIFLVYGIIHILELYGILPQGFLPYSETIYCLLGACLFSFFLAYHTRLIVSGKYTKIQMNEKDYVLGAMCLYNDIINMFIYILRILGEDRD